MSWLSLALGIIQLLGWITTKLDSAEKDRALRALIAQEELKDDLASIAKADAARDAVDRDIAADPGRLREPDSHVRNDDA